MWANSYMCFKIGKEIQSIIRHQSLQLKTVLLCANTTRNVNGGTTIQFTPPAGWKKHKEIPGETARTPICTLATEIALTNAQKYQKRKTVVPKEIEETYQLSFFHYRPDLSGGGGDRECDDKGVWRGAQKCLGESPCRDDHQARDRVNDPEWALLRPGQDRVWVAPLVSQHPVWLYRPRIYPLLSNVQE